MSSNEDSHSLNNTRHRLELNGGIVVTQGGAFISKGQNTINVGGSVNNSGTMKFGVGTKLNIAYDLINSGHFEFALGSQDRDELLTLLNNAIEENKSTIQHMLEETMTELKLGHNVDSKVKSISRYVSRHPDLAVGALQLLLGFLQLKAQS